MVIWDSGHEDVHTLCVRGCLGEHLLVERRGIEYVAGEVAAALQDLGICYPFLQINTTVLQTDEEFTETFPLLPLKPTIGVHTNEVPVLPARVSGTSLPKSRHTGWQDRKHLKEIRIAVPAGLANDGLHSKAALPLHPEVLLHLCLWTESARLVAMR